MAPKRRHGKPFLKRMLAAVETNFRSVTACHQADAAAAGMAQLTPVPFSPQ